METKPKFKAGDKFKITHVDGYIANETVSEVSFYANQYYYLCNSCACYRDRDFINLKSIESSHRNKIFSNLNAWINIKSEILKGSERINPFRYKTFGKSVLIYGNR